MKQAENRLQSALDYESFDYEDVFGCLDQFKFAISLSKEKNLEVEGICCAHLTKLFYKFLKMNKKAKEYGNRCVHILESLKPKIFTDYKWYKLMMKHMTEI